MSKAKKNKSDLWLRFDLWRIVSCYSPPSWLVVVLIIVFVVVVRGKQSEIISEVFVCSSKYLLASTTRYRTVYL